MKKLIKRINFIIENIRRNFITRLKNSTMSRVMLCDRILKLLTGLILLSLFSLILLILLIIFIII